ncbi:MAG: hypothetical protein PHQ23_04855 [Candidatus Wallbacteria bacterium]|nr:hypothetical protein [Candidatus Wallbacteria bacterium]
MFSIIGTSAAAPAPSNGALQKGGLQPIAVAAMIAQKQMTF